MRRGPDPRRRRVRWPARPVALGAALAALLGGGPSEATLYRWVDAEGVVRYTNVLERIPPAFQAAAERVATPRPRAAPEDAPAGAAGDPTVVPWSGGPIRAAAALNGVPLVLLVDTGADRTVIAPAALLRAGVDPTAGRPVELQGVTGAAPAREVRVLRLDVAGASVGPLTVVAHDVEVPGVDGLLGRDVLELFTLTVDPAAGRAVLAPR